jgi:DDE family transposase
MNVVGKVGAPFHYSDSYFWFLAFLKISFKIPYRMVLEIVHGLAEYVMIIEEIHFTQIRKRMIGIKPSIENDDDNEEPITLVVDVSGLTVSKKGDYIEEKWIRRKRSLSNYISLLTQNSSVEPVIAKRNSSTRERRCPLRREEILSIKELGYQRCR